MINLRFSRLPKHRKFKYLPMYYDEQKEDLHARVQDAKRSMGESMNSDNITKQNIRKLYQSKQHIQRYGSPSQRNYRIRLGIILIILSMIAYKLIYSNALEFILQAFTR